MTIAEYLVPGWTVAMRHKFPNVVASVSLHNSSDVSAQVQAGQADIGFVEGPDVPSALASCEVARDHLVVVVPPGHDWANGVPFPGEELDRPTAINAARETGG